MYILAVETTGLYCSAAVKEADGSAPAAVRSEAEPMTHLKMLIPLTKQLLESEHIDKKEIAAVAASVGPGSFTGIRIGVSTARALAQALDIPCIAVSSLEQFSLLAQGEPIAVIFNARRGQVYGAVFDGDGKAIMEPGPYMLTDVLEFVDKNDIDPVFYGDGVDAYADSLEGRRTADKEYRYQTAELTAEAAVRKYKNKELLKYNELLPDYMRESEAEQRLKDGSLEKMRAAKMAKFMGR